jgi:hypothetical protein
VAEKQRPRKIVGAPGLSRSAVENFNAAQLAAERARLLGQDENEAFARALKAQWKKGAEKAKED